MTIDFQRACFQQSAPNLSHCPTDVGAEVAFIGRSNAGKSSLINALCRQKKLARTSKTPGRTQLLNFFTLSENAHFRLVDLPGYGFASVSKDMREQWDVMLEEYLCGRSSLKLLVIVMDVRHPLQESDQHMIHWASRAKIPVYLVLTKSDKLSRGAANNVLMAVKKRYPSAQLFSAENKTGLEELTQRLGAAYE